ncbi:unnamed protein product [Cyclocybe aegerita]|uniref:Arrestin-like N-terminal domain-containing protein n=1 Tax=Cyclocybe aegerita TaxID=1973307 RepID=A0A8S0XE03_CYCAE|nr:unnamed protein product [Cyclocybe aegerita]
MDKGKGGKSEDFDSLTSAPILPPDYSIPSTRFPNRFSTRWNPPPRYSSVFGDPEEPIRPGASHTEHEFSLQTGLFTSKTWVKLRILTRPSSVAHNVPKIFGGENVSGIVQLILENSQAVHSIVISLKGRIVTSFSDIGYYTFLDHSCTLWDKSMGDPRAPGVGTKFDGKLTGDYELSFSFPFPTEVDISSGTVGKGKRVARAALVCPTPQTFLERDISANVEYELVLQITHGILRTVSKLKAPVIFIPQITPDPPSPMRQLAYSENAMLPGPEADIEGWTALRTLEVRGVLEDSKPFDLHYTIYLATPLCYTRGTVIPCYLMISSQDTRSLDTFADPKSQHVRLVRRVRFFEDPSKGIGQSLSGKAPKVSEEIDEAEVAVWWVPPKDVPQEPSNRRLEGEIHLSNDLVPSSDFLPFKVDYVVEVLPFRASGVTYSATSHFRVKGDKSPEVALSHPVTIATFRAKGPVPTTFTERQKSSKAKKRQRDGEEKFQRMNEYGLNLGVSS